MLWLALYCIVVVFVFLISQMEGDRRVDDFFVSAHTVSCHYDDLRCHRWRRVVGLRIFCFQCSINIIYTHGFTVIFASLKCTWYTTGKKYGIFGKHSTKKTYLTFWFAGNDLALTTNKYCDFNATFICSVMDEKLNFHCPTLKIYNRMFRNVSFLIFNLKSPTTSGVFIIAWWMYENVMYSIICLLV